MIYTLAKILAISLLIYPALAVALILSDPVRALEPNPSFDFSGTLSRESPMPETHPMLERTRLQTPDGAAHPVIHVRDPEQPNRPLIVMLHGSSWHGGQFEALAWSLRDTADSLAITLRGHGADPERRGDIDYIGQFEDDLAHFIRPHAETGRPIFLLGHSSGGGLAVRFAGGAHGDMLSGAVLLAPFLKHDAPSTKQNSGGWAKLHLRRLIGQTMLTNIGITALNHLPMIQFNMPRAVLDGPYGTLATTAYSYRLNTSFAPRQDYLADVAALPQFLLVAGAADEAFHAAEYEPLMSSVTAKGRYVLVPGVAHLDIVDAAQTETAIRDFLRELD